jgi:hypothetical protein
MGKLLASTSILVHSHVTLAVIMPSARVIWVWYMSRRVFVLHDPSTQQHTAGSQGVNNYCHLYTPGANVQGLNTSQTGNTMHTAFIHYKKGVVYVGRLGLRLWGYHPVATRHLTYGPFVHCL